LLDYAGLKPAAAITRKNRCPDVGAWPQELRLTSRMIRSIVAARRNPENRNPTANGVTSNRLLF